VLGRQGSRRHARPAGRWVALHCRAAAGGQGRRTPGSPITRDVLPISLQENWPAVPSASPRSAPFALMTYKQRPRKTGPATSRNTLRDRRMPPWEAGRGARVWPTNERKLNEKQIRPPWAAWADGGGPPEGEPGKSHGRPRRPGKFHPRDGNLDSASPDLVREVAGGVLLWAQAARKTLFRPATVLPDGAD